MSYFTRLSWNSNGWKKPSGTPNKCFGTGESRLYECIHGFGWEEWLFRFTKHNDGYCYGFLQCFNKIGREKQFFNELYLYTRKCEGSCQVKAKSISYYVGKIKNVEVLDRRDRDTITQVILQNEEQMKNDMRNAGVQDYEVLFEEMKECRSVFNIRFKEKDVIIRSGKIENCPIDIPRNCYRFLLYDLTDKPKFLLQLNKIK